MASSAPCPKRKRPMLTFDGLDAGVDPFTSRAAAKPGAQSKEVVSPTLEIELELVELHSKRQKKPGYSVLSIEEEEPEQGHEDAAVGALQRAWPPP